MRDGVASGTGSVAGKKRTGEGERGREEGVDVRAEEPSVGHEHLVEDREAVLAVLDPALERVIDHLQGLHIFSQF
eukprot:3520386-Rhodomonas_salina.1